MNRLGRKHVNQNVLGRLHPPRNHVAHLDSFASIKQATGPGDSKSFFPLRPECARDAATIQRLREQDPEVVIIGTGTRHVFPPPGIVAPLMQDGIGVEIMSTAAACRTYNVLGAEGRRVVALLLPIEQGPSLAHGSRERSGLHPRRSGRPGWRIGSGDHRRHGRSSGSRRQLRALPRGSPRGIRLVPFRGASPE